MKNSIIIVLTVIFVLFTACSGEKPATEQKAVHTADKIVTTPTSDADHTRVVIEVQGYGNMVVETYPEYAPETVSTFIELVNMGYYDGMSIDKIIPGRAMEISDETSLSSGERKETITGEFAKNGHSNDLPLLRGTLAMCHLPGEYNSATAKFMIILDDNAGFDGEYAGFAQIVDGVYIFDQISKLSPDADGVPVSPIVMKKLYIQE